MSVLISVAPERYDHIGMLSFMVNMMRAMFTTVRRIEIRSTRLLALNLLVSMISWFGCFPASLEPSIASHCSIADHKPNTKEYRIDYIELIYYGHVKITRICLIFALRSNFFVQHKKSTYHSCS